MIFAYYLIVGLFIGLSVFFSIITITQLQWQVPEDEREYLDPLPLALRVIWPVTRFVTYYVGQRVSSKVLENAHTLLARSGSNYMMSPEEFVSVRIIVFFITFVISLLLTNPLGINSIFISLAFSILGFYYPVIWAKSRYEQRKKEILKTLPMFLDYIVLAVEAGTNFSGALAQTVEKGPTGAMRHEFFIVLRDLRSGLTRADALRRMDSRLEISEISSVVSSIIQAEQVGASIGNILRMQAERRRTERFQRAEKLAMEAPVKLMFPLVVFIFPTTFIVLAFPIIMMIKQQGLI